MAVPIVVATIMAIDMKNIVGKVVMEGEAGGAGMDGGKWWDLEDP